MNNVKIPTEISEFIVVGNVSENAFALDTSHFFGQKEDISDLISLKTFENTEFCPRFLNDLPEGLPGECLKGKGVVIASSSLALTHTRNEIAMRNLLVARAAKDNGAAWVLLFEPDLFYSAQDRGPQLHHGKRGDVRTAKDCSKFSGQAFSALLYAELLKKAGVDEVMTIHNHSESVRNVYSEVFNGHFSDLLPHRLYARYIQESDIVNFDNLMLCAPDQGALEFVLKTRDACGINDRPYLLMSKDRTGEREVSMELSPDSPGTYEDIEGRDIIVIDDMVRTGSTIVNCCRILKKYNPRKVVFLVTHFHSSKEGRLNLASDAVDEVVTTNSIPSILNRDVQGRLRHKIAVLKMSRWVAHHL
ncbi:MAG: ribose-phosphate pyrophosphokinase, partial [Planctomycetes bacterium]|nr:ribose-phosphate pyrophosphokinase [Planctomycetota bacterium]